MKLLICSDLHGSRNAAKIVTYLMEKYGFDKLILLGDLLYNGPRNYVEKDYDPSFVYKELNKFSDKIIACKGNCESDVDLMVLNFKMPIFNSFKNDDYLFYLNHGHINEIKLESNIDKNEILMSGHTHIPLFKHSKNGGIILNPGSMTFPKGSIDKSFMIMDDDDLYLIEFDYDENDNYIVKNKYKFSDGDRIFER